MEEKKGHISPRPKRLGVPAEKPASAKPSQGYDYGKTNRTVLRSTIPDSPQSHGKSLVPKPGTIAKKELPAPLCAKPVAPKPAAPAAASQSAAKAEEMVASPQATQTEDTQPVKTEQKAAEMAAQERQADSQALTLPPAQPTEADAAPVMRPDASFLSRTLNGTRKRLGASQAKAATSSERRFGQADNMDPIELAAQIEKSSTPDAKELLNPSTRIMPNLYVAMKSGTMYACWRAERHGEFVLLEGIFPRLSSLPKYIESWHPAFRNGIRVRESEIEAIAFGAWESNIPGCTLTKKRPQENAA